MKLILIAMLLASVSGYAKKTKSTEMSTTQTMNKSLEAITNLMPYISYDLKYRDVRFQKIIQENIQALALNFKLGKHNKEFSEPGFHPSFEVLQEHLDETIDTFNSQSKDYSFVLARNITPLCISCHNQLPKEYTSAFSAGIKKLKLDHFETQFEYAEFLYLVRDYNQAQTNYLKVIDEKLKTQKKLKIAGESIQFDDSVLSQSIRKVLEINVRIKRNFKDAIKQLKKVVKNKNLPSSDVQDINQWIKDLERWSKQQTVVNKINTQKELNSFIEKYLNPLRKSGITITEESTVDMLVVSGVLSNYLFKHGDKENTAQLLLWMGIAENVLGKNIFYTLGDNYLKTCVEKFPTSKAANDCYSEYSDSIEFRYTGSAGTSIPSALKKNLQRLKSLLK